MKVSLIYFFVSLLNMVQVDSTSAIQGQVLRADQDENVFLAEVALFRDDLFVANCRTDIRGGFSFTDLTPGLYTLVVRSNNQQQKKVEDLYVQVGATLAIKVELKAPKKESDLAEVVAEVGARSLIRLIDKLFKK